MRVKYNVESWGLERYFQFKVHATLDSTGRLIAVLNEVFGSYWRFTSEVEVITDTEARGLRGLWEPTLSNKGFDGEYRLSEDEDEFRLDLQELYAAHSR